MPLLKNPRRLYAMCLELVVSLLEKAAAQRAWRPGSANPLDALGGEVVSDAMLAAHARYALRPGAWRLQCEVFLTPGLRRAVLPWDKDLLAAASKCQRLVAVLVSGWRRFSADSLRRLPRSVATLDFHGELFFRGARGPALQFAGRAESGWLPDAEDTLRALHVWRQKPPRLEPGALVEVHLGDVPVTVDQLRGILEREPQLQLLRHYLLVSALYSMHAAQWRNNEGVPVYKLRNLDADFSHVGSSSTSPGAVLAPDALQLAARLCPEACRAHVRVNPWTPPDVLDPLCGLRRLRELSVVCVSSGERCLLDFSDVARVLTAHKASLESLELKVLEEVDVHVVLEHCKRLERLVVSGCGNVYPETCGEHGCARPSARRGPRLPRLRHLFFADGDDYSWDHAVPQCFWFAVLAPGRSGQRSRLEGVFLESPRLSAAHADKLFLQARHDGALYPHLQVLSLCRVPELNYRHLQAIAGLSGGDGGTAALRYLRISDCEQLGPRYEKRLRNALKQGCPTDDVLLLVE